MSWDVEQWLDDGPMCTRCHVTLGWEGDPPESEDDAICNDCAWAELDALRNLLAAVEQDPQVTDCQCEQDFCVARRKAVEALWAMRRTTQATAKENV